MSFEIGRWPHHKPFHVLFFLFYILFFVVSRQSLFREWLKTKSKKIVGKVGAGPCGPYPWTDYEAPSLSRSIRFTFYILSWSHTSLNSQN